MTTILKTLTSVEVPAQVRRSEAHSRARTWSRLAELLAATAHASTQAEPQLLLGPQGGPIWVHGARGRS